MEGASEEIRVSDLGEDALIALLTVGCPATAPGLRLGIGDDAAVLNPTGANSLVITADMLVEGVHFPLAMTGWWRGLGHKAIACNVSDIAAMGGTPAAAVVCIGLPGYLPVRQVQELYEGIRTACDRWNVILAGGDTVRSDRVVIAVTMTGSLHSTVSPATRSAAREGHRVYVTGALGAAAAGLECIQAEGETTMPPDRAADLMLAHWFTYPPVALGPVLARRYGSSLAMMDISDSLDTDLRRLASASNVGIQIHLSAIPVSPLAREWAAATRSDPTEVAVYSGEEYQLLFTLPPEEDPTDAATESGMPAASITCIGRVTDSTFGVQYLDKLGAPRALNARQPFSHFPRA